MHSPVPYMTEELIRVAYQGAPGAFSEEAALSYFATRLITCVAQREFTDVRRAVIAGEAAYGVLPIENSIHGPVTRSLAVFEAGGLEIVGEVTCPIRLCLLVVPAARPEQLRRVLSHPVALGQCRRFLATMPLIAPVSHYDTAGAARDVAARGDITHAAVASQRAAARYDLDIVARNIEDRPDNRTHFMIVRRTGADGPAVSQPLCRPGASLARLDSEPPVPGGGECPERS